METIKVDHLRKDKSVNILPSSRKRGKQRSADSFDTKFDRVVVCEPGDGDRALEAVRAGRDRNKAVVFEFGSDCSFAKRGWNKRGVPCVLWLPRSFYLIRVMKLPASSPDDLRAMAMLEVEASLPADFGDIDVGYRPLVSSDRYEVYAVKQSLLDEAVSQVEAAGLRPTHVLPMAILYAEVLESMQPDTDMLVLRDPGRQAEAAFLNRDGSVSVRQLTNKDNSTLDTELVDSVRAAASQRPRIERPIHERSEVGISFDPIRVAWLGEMPPGSDIPEALAVQLLEVGSGPESASEGSPLLSFAAQSILDGKAGGVDWATINMLPKARSAARQQVQRVRHLVVGAVTFSIAVFLVYAALWTSATRYERQVAELDQEIARIASSGEAVGERLDQLRAVSSAFQTRQDFGAVIAALHEASPPDGLSYSQVDLNIEGQLRLRGQAESLAMPFELPEKLEANPWFERVVLRDAGQAKKGVGSITEFRVEANLVRPRTPEAHSLLGTESSVPPYRTEATP